MNDYLLNLKHQDQYKYDNDPYDNTDDKMNTQNINKNTSFENQIIFHAVENCQVS